MVRLPIRASERCRAAADRVSASLLISLRTLAKLGCAQRPLIEIKRAVDLRSEKRRGKLQAGAAIRPGWCDPQQRARCPGGPVAEAPSVTSTRAVTEGGRTRRSGRRARCRANVRRALQLSIEWQSISTAQPQFARGFDRARSGGRDRAGVRRRAALPLPPAPACGRSCLAVAADAGDGAEASLDPRRGVDRGAGRCSTNMSGSSSAAGRG